MRISRRDFNALALVMLTLVVCALFFTWQRGREAVAMRNNALAEYSATASQVRELLQLRDGQALVDDRPRPEPDLVARLQDHLHAAGVAANSLSQVTSGQSQRVDSTPYRRQVITITVNQMNPEQIVRFCSRWRDAEPQWIMRSIRLRYAGNQAGRRSRQRGNGAPGQSFDLLVTLENLYVAEFTDRET